MSLMPLDDQAPLNGEVEEIFAQMQASIGFVPNAFRMLSGNPLWLRQQWEFIGYYMNHPSLSFALQALIRLLVSTGAKCSYCVDMNASMLIQMAGWTPEQVAAARLDPENVPLPDRDKRLLRLILKALVDSNSLSAADMDQARDMGWSDRDILDALNHAARQLSIDFLINAVQVDRDY